MQDREMIDFRKVDVIEPTPTSIDNPIGLVEQRLGRQKDKG